MSVGTGRLSSEPFRKLIDPILLTVAILLIWDVGVTVTNLPALILPTPRAIFQTLMNARVIIAGEGVTTLKFIVIGFGIGGVFGIVCAFAVHYSKLISRLMFPVLMIAFVVPKIAFAPLLLLYLGVGSNYFLVMSLLFVFFPVLENTLTGLRGVDDDLLDLAKIYQTPNWFTFRYVEVPYALPYVGAGLKIGMREATVGVVVAEIIAPRWGLGSLLMIGQTYGRTSLIFGSIFVIGFIGIVLYKSVEAIEERVIFWRDVEGGVA